MLNGLTDLYNSLYGTDVIPETKGAVRGKTYNPIRGQKVIEYARNFLDENIPLKKGSWKNIKTIPIVHKNKLNLELKNPQQFVGYNKKSNLLSNLVQEKKAPAVVKSVSNSRHLNIGI